MNWAVQAVADSSAMARRLVGPVTQDSCVAAALGTVTVEDLQLVCVLKVKNPAGTTAR